MRFRKDDEEMLKDLPDHVLRIEQRYRLEGHSPSVLFASCSCGRWSMHPVGCGPRVRCTCEAQAKQEHQLHVSSHYEQEVDGWRELLAELERHMLRNALCRKELKRALERLDRHSELSRQAFVSTLKEHCLKDLCNTNDLVYAFHSIGQPIDKQWNDGLKLKPINYREDGQSQIDLDTLAVDDAIMAEIQAMELSAVVSELCEILGGPKRAGEVLYIHKTIRLRRWADATAGAKPATQRSLRLMLRIVRLIASATDVPDMAYEWLVTPNGHLGDITPSWTLYMIHPYTDYDIHADALVLSAARAFVRAAKKSA